MTRRQRTILFSIAAAIFCVISPAIILYAAGYRLDIALHRLVKTGGLSLTAGPQPVDAYVNGKLVSSNNFIFRNIFISNLLPKNYTVQLQKDGYYSWQKTLSVLEGKVTEALTVVLYPKNPRSATITSSADSLFASTDGSRILFTQSGSAGKSLFLVNGKTDALKIKTLAQQETIEQIIFAQDNNTFIEYGKINGAAHLWLGDISNQFSSLQDISSFIPVAVLLHVAASLIQFSQDEKSIYLLSSGASSKEGIYVLHLDTHTFEGPVQSNVNGFLSVQDGVYTTESITGLLLKCSSDFSSCDQISRAPLSIPSNGFSTILTDGDHLVFLQDKKLYFYKPDEQAFAFITDGVNKIFFSPDKQKMAIQKDREILVYWFKDITRGDQHKQGDVNLLLRISEKISDLAWITNPYQYIAVESNDALRIVELDGRDVRNIISYPEFSSVQNIISQKDSASLILLHGKTLLQDFVEE